MGIKPGTGGRGRGGEVALSVCWCVVCGVCEWCDPKEIVPLALNIVSL